MHTRTIRARIDDAALHRVTRLFSETLDETAGDPSARETAVADPALPLAHGRSVAPREERRTAGRERREETGEHRKPCVAGGRGSRWRA